MFEYTFYEGGLGVAFRHPIGSLRGKALQFSVLNVRELAISWERKIRRLFKAAPWGGEFTQVVK